MITVLIPQDNAKSHQEIFDNHVRPPPVLDQPWPDFSQNLGLENMDFYDL